MTDLNDHPFAPANVAYESGKPSAYERRYFAFLAAVERIVGHSLDGNQTTDGYSLDFAHDAFADGMTAEEYALEVINLRTA